MTQNMHAVIVILAIVIAAWFTEGPPWERPSMVSLGYDIR